MLNKITTILSLCLVGCLTPVESESELIDETIQSKEVGSPTWSGRSPGNLGCGSVYQELQGPNGITMEIPVECVPFYIYMGDPFERENPSLGRQEQLWDR